MSWFSKKSKQERELDTKILPGNSTGDQSDFNSEDESILEVSAAINVWVDLNIPIRGDVALALNLLPVKILIERAGALIADGVLRNLGPALGSRLIQDYESRKKTGFVKAERTLAREQDTQDVLI
jgi:hypothetical protein